MRVQLGRYSISVEPALSATQHEIGLSYHSHLAFNEGMLFIFLDESFRTFHMAQVPFPIDIIGLDRNFYITKVFQDCQPGSGERFVFSGVNYVLEVNAGTFRSSGACVGQRAMVDTPLLRRSQLKRAQVVDEGKFITSTAQALDGKLDGLEWAPDRLNGGATERCVITRASLAKLLTGKVDPSSLQMILTAAGSQEDLSKIGDAFLTLGACDTVKLGYMGTGPTLVLYRSTVDHNNDGLDDGDENSTGQDADTSGASEGDMSPTEDDD